MNEPIRSRSSWLRQFNHEIYGATHNLTTKCHLQGYIDEFICNESVISYARNGSSATTNNALEYCVSGGGGAGIKVILLLRLFHVQNLRSIYSDIYISISFVSHQMWLLINYLCCQELKVFISYIVDLVVMANCVLFFCLNSYIESGCFDIYPPAVGVAGAWDYCLNFSDIPDCKGVS
uniref:Uncharacterized protein n=1 Tax=Glossina austeni TaxID=7395 RepID=A0A1A9UTT1_GLOAU